MGSPVDVALYAPEDAELHKALATHPAEAPPFHVPFLRNPSFVGREDDLAKLHALLQKGGAVGVGPAALTGMGGIGKTQLAVEYAYRYAEAYPGGVYWVNAARPWQAELAALAEKVGLREDDAPEAARQQRLARAFAAYLREHTDALVIFDNTDDPLELRNASLDIVPEQLACRLLFTTRRREMPFAMLDVGVLPEGDALRLLLSKRPAPSADDQRAATTLCRTLGGLPLALALAAAYLDKHPRITLAGYLDGIEKHGVLVVIGAAGIDPRLLATQHEKAVNATLAEQWDTLGGEGSARFVLQAASLLGEAAQIARATLSLLTGLGDAPESWREAPLEEVLRELSGLSLVEVLGEHALRLHPLVRVFAEGTIAEKERFKAECAARLADALWDMGRLHNEVAGRGVDAVLRDLRVGSELAGASERGRIKALLRPLDREAHALRRWDRAEEPGFLLQQLRNRCFEMGVEEVRERAEAQLGERSWSWLRERIQTSRESEALVRTLEGHTNMVNGVAVTSDGRFAVSASYDKTLKVWDLDTGQVLRTLEGHAAAVLGVAVTSDGRFAVSASYDKTLKVWDLDTGQALRTLEGHAAAVLGVAVTSDGRFAVSASCDKMLKVWDVDTGQALRTLEGHTESVDGVAVTSDGRFAVSVSEDNTLKVWDVATGQALRTLEGHTSNVFGVAVTSDGRFAVSASEDNTLKVWDLATGQALRTLEGHTSYVFSVAVTPDGRFAISASEDNTLKVWDLATGQALRTLEGHTSYVFSVAVTSDGRFAVSASQDKTLKVWDLNMGQARRPLEGHTKSVRGVDLTSDGRFAVSASEDNTLKVWDLATGQARRTLEGHTGTVTGVAVTSDGRFVVSAAQDNTLKVWDLATGQALRALEERFIDWIGVAVTSDGRFAVSTDGRFWLKVWDLATGQALHLHTLAGHISGVSGVAVTSDGRFAVSASWDTTLKVWDLTTGQALRTLEGHTSAVNSVALTSDGRFVVSASSDKTLKVWDLTTGQALRTLEGHTKEVGGVSVTSDGRFAVSASYDKTLKVWDLRTGQSLATLETHASFKCCAITADGKTILAGDDAGALHILDWMDPKIHGPRALISPSHPPPASTLALSRLPPAGPSPMTAPLSPVPVTRPADHKGKVDFAILTIRDDEFQAVLDRFPPYARARGRRIYNLHRLDLPAGGAYDVAVLKCIEQGNAEALDAARDVLEELDPRWLVVVGIAGGVPSDELTLGDVVVSTRIVDFSVEAVLEDKAPEYALMGGPVAKEAAVVLADLRALAGELGDWNDPTSIRVPRPRIEIDGGEFYGDEAWQAKARAGLARQAERKAPIVTGGAIGSSDKLVKDTKILATFLLKAARQVIAVEMESAGVYRAATGRGVPLVAIRGLSDVVGFKRDPGWTAYACHSAAAFTRAFLRTGPIEPRASAPALPGSPEAPAVPRSYDRFELCDALCRMTPVQFELTLFRTGASPAQISAEPAALARRALDLVVYMEQQGAGGLDKLAEAIKKIAPHVLH